MARRARVEFDKAYYDRFYRDPRTRVGAKRDAEVLGDFVCSYLRHLGVPLRRVLDIGCGLGHLQPVIARHFPRARYHGVEVSSYLCRELGWEHGSVTDYRGRGRFDLVICQGVLQYLDRDQAVAAIDNLGRLCRGALYLEALTSEDWATHCDRHRSDGEVYLRGERFYRTRLKKHFHSAGGGVFLHHDAEVVLFSLER